MSGQPMGLGAPPPPLKLEEAEKKAATQEREAVLRRAKLYEELQNTPTLGLLFRAIKATMLRTYNESTEGKVQQAFLRDLQREIDPEMMAELLTVEQMIGTVRRT